MTHACTKEHLFAENKEKLISSAISSLISKEGDQDAISGPELEQQLHCLRRLVASKAGFSCFTTLSGFRHCFKSVRMCSRYLSRPFDFRSQFSIRIQNPFFLDKDLEILIFQIRISSSTRTRISVKTTLLFQICEKI